MVYFKPRGQLTLAVTAFPPLLCRDILLLGFTDTALARILAGIEDTAFAGAATPTATL